MFSFFESLSGIFTIIVDFIVDMISVLVSLFTLMGKFFISSEMLVMALPQFLIMPAAIILAIVIIYHVLNRS